MAPPTSFPFQSATARDALARGLSAAPGTRNLPAEGEQAMKRGWFGPKRIGWGACPASREGWLATGLAVLAVIGASIGFGHQSHGWTAPALVLVVHSILVILTYRHDARTPF